MHDGEDGVRKARRPTRKQPSADAAVLNEIQLQEPIQITEQGWHCIRLLSDTVPCCCDPEVVSAHLFTLATMAVCFAADFKHNNRKDKCRFFGFRVIVYKAIQKVGSLYLSNFNSLKKK